MPRETDEAARLDGQVEELEAERAGPEEQLRRLHARAAEIRAAGAERARWERERDEAGADVARLDASAGMLAERHVAALRARLVAEACCERCLDCVAFGPTCWAGRSPGSKPWRISGSAGSRAPACGSGCARPWRRNRAA